MIDNIQFILIIILIFSVILHEVAHGLTAYMLGDSTAERAGRITLNPIPHIDLFGTIIVPAVFLLSGTSAFLAWAKPVPFNPNNLNDKKWGELKVAIAGPISNIILMLIFIISVVVINFFGIGNEVIFYILFWAGFINLFLAIFNLIPLVPLDGSKVLFSLLPFEISRKIKYFMDKYYLYIFLIFLFIIFNTSFIFEWIRFIYEKIFFLIN
ncbi:protein containing Peptidase M50 domain [sediment metagenome]|uniref:Protein containing Peptidase M50 domain n=1 Tax=sediment metagenome TaxID=749907 RepID=D9PMW3_9ZZZZ